MIREHRRLTPTQVYLRVAAMVALPLAFVALLPALYATYRVWQVADDAQRTAAENREATCSFVNDLQLRYDSTAAYIKAVEQRRVAPIPGVNIHDLKIQNASRRATLASFSDLDCKEG